MEDNKTEIRKICKACGASKLMKDFRKHPTCAGGYYPRCKHCIANKNMIYSEKNKKQSGIDDFLGMTGTNKQTYIDMYLFLQKMGYDISKPIAEQFAEKHNLKVKQRSAHNPNKYTPESLGLI